MEKPMRTFRNPFLNWLVEHPALALFIVLAVVIVFFPLLLNLTPIRTVPLRYNLRNLQNRWKTTLVTALAFTFVIGLLTFMMSFVRGMDRLIESSGNPGNVMVLSDGATDEAFSNLPPFSKELLPKDLQEEIVLSAQEVYVVVTYMIPNQPPRSKARRFVQLRGMDNMETAATIHGVQLGTGDWPGPAAVRKIGDTETALEVVIGNGVAQAFGADIGKDRLEVGDTLTLGPRKWIVVGIMGEGSTSFSSEIWTRDRHVQENFGRENSYCSYIVRTKGPEKAKLAVELLKNFKSERNLQAFTEQEYYAKMSDTNKQFSFAIGVVAVIMAIGGMLGIMNTMYAAISQRSKDIGVLRLMGYRRWQILISFQLESMLIAILGGLFGCMMAYLLFNGVTVTSILSSGAGGGGKTVVLKLIYDLRIFAFGMIFTSLMGWAGGLLPALTAMQVRPLESLK
jgi:ABC-type lipoprotein release transport system permease subunit